MNNVEIAIERYEQVHEIQVSQLPESQQRLIRHVVFDMLYWRDQASAGYVRETPFRGIAALDLKDRNVESLDPPQD